MTYASKKVVKELLLNDGTYPGDPQMSSIWKYNSARDHRELYAVFADESHNDIYESPYVENPVLLWERWGGLTDCGEKFLRENSGEKHE